jgi:hypothetical protein
MAQKAVEFVLESPLANSKEDAQLQRAQAETHYLKGNILALLKTRDSSITEGSKNTFHTP